MPEIWRPQPGPQLAALEADWCFELFYGGARGGGKSSFILGDNQDAALRYGRAWSAVVFRQSYPQLEELMQQAFDVFPATGATFHQQPSATYPVSNCWYWPNGATVRMRYIEREADVQEYQGHAYSGVYFDELPNWASPGVYTKMLACVRPSGMGDQAVLRRVRATGNPGGAGHHWVKERFIDPAPMGFVPMQTPMGFRMFIPARVADNRVMLDADPQYIDRLREVGSESLVRMWLDGDWSAVEGAFFTEFNTRRHVVKQHRLPEHWTRFRAMDWGYAKPFCVSWFAVSDGELPQYPRGALVMYREWYGASRANVGIKLPAEDIADGIARQEAGENIVESLCVLDPATFAATDGPSIAERMFARGVKFRRADNRRVGQFGALGGWDQVRARLRGEAEGAPMLFMMDNCTATIRTLPAMKHDADRPEDMDTDGEDHAVDALRYGCMARPFVRDAVESDSAKVMREWAEITRPLTMNDLIAATPVNTLPRERI